MEISDVGRLLEKARVAKGLSKAAVTRVAKISPTTLDKIYKNGSRGVKEEKLAAVEHALDLDLGTIRALTEGVELGDSRQKEIEITGHPDLKDGERLYKKETTEGTLYRLEIAQGYGASYTWENPTPYPEVIRNLRALCKMVESAGGLIES